MNLKIFWNKLKYWQRGAIIGFTIYLPILILSLLMCFGDSTGATREGCEGAGWLLLFLGLPTSLIEIFLEKLDLSIREQVFNLLFLDLLQYVLGGAIIGWIISKFIKK